MIAWPDPKRPGVPLHPERDGWHWLHLEDDPPEVWMWDAEQEHFQDANGLGGPITTHPAWAYHGPCLLPAEVAALVAAAERRGAEAMRERAAKAAMGRTFTAGDMHRAGIGRSTVYMLQPTVARHGIAETIRKLPLPGDPA